jgi:tetratricopeptide (TPR) repeat protein
VAPVVAGEATPGTTLSVDRTRTASVSVGLAPGALFDHRYRIERMLGFGGMGTVYKARDQKLGVPIALKVIRPEVLSNPTTRIAFETRFKQELLLARQVTHPNVLRVHDLGEVDGVIYITMPFVEGSDLHAMLKTGPLPFERVLSLARQITSGLTAADEVGVVHRDLKPQNILVDASGRAYISDFGLAKSYDASASGLTRPGDLIGTPRYMAPEYVEGQPADHRSDLYALGLILYESASGSRPFPGGGALDELIQRVRLVPRALNDVASDVPRFFTEIVMRCLERDPTQRYQHARDLLKDLERSAGPDRIPNQPSKSSVERQTFSVFRPRRPMVVTIVAVCLAGGLVVTSPVRNLLGRTGANTLTLPSTGKRKLVAVLPFRVQGTTQEMEQWDHIATGMAEALSAGLVGLTQLTVAPTAAVEGVDPNLPHAKLASELGSNLLVTGTLQDTGSGISILITLEDLIAAQTIWTHEFQAAPNDALTLRDQMLTELVGALNPTTTVDERAKGLARPTQNNTAYDLYLKGRYAMRRQPDRQHVEMAITFYNEALKLDPRFALAFAALADASIEMYHETHDTTWADKALYAAQKGQRIDDSLLEVRTVAGQAYLATGKTNEAIAELTRALEIAPNSDGAYRRLAVAYRIAGRPDEAIKNHKLAIEKNPYYWLNHNSLGATYWRLGQWDKAGEEFKKVIEIKLDDVNSYNDLGAMYLQLAQYTAAADAFQRALKIVPTAETWSNLGIAYAWMGKFSDALPAYQKAVEISPESDNWLSNLADGYRWTGDRQKAVETYDKAIAIADKALTVNPNDAVTRFNLGTYYAKKGDAAQAMKFINASLEKDPGNANFLYNLALAYALAHHNDQALDTLRTALKDGYPRSFVRDDPDFVNLVRTDPRVRALLQESSPTLKQ